MANGALKVLVLGVGNMGRSHALAYHKINGFEIVGLCSPGIHGRKELPDALGQSFVVRHEESQDTVVATRSKDVGRMLSEPDTTPCRGRAR